MEKMYVWTVATGEVKIWRKESREAVQYIKTLEGLVGVHPVPGRGVLWLFDSENNAKGARNLMQSKGIQCGTNICHGCINGDTLEMDGVADG